MGDTHIGTVHCAEDRLAKDVRKIVDDPIARLILFGDMTDCIPITDKRFDPACVKEEYRLRDLAKLPQIQAWDLIHQIRPASEKVDGLLKGNHEGEMLRKNSFDACGYYLKGLELGEEKYLDVSALLRYNIYRGDKEALEFTLYVEHGTGSSQSAEAALRRIKKKENDVLADLYICGHHHKPIHEVLPQVQPRYWTPNGELKECRKGFVVTPAYQKTLVIGVAGYAESRSYRTVELGSSMIEWDLDTKQFEIRRF